MYSLYGDLENLRDLIREARNQGNGDSIDCNVDSITDTYIYSEMKSKNYWKHTHINKYEKIN